MYGGVLSRIPTEESLDDHVRRIITNSRRELISHGMYGFVYSVAYEDSGFMDYERGILATTFVMKLIPIDMYMAHHIDGEYARRTNDLRYVKREIAYQRKVYKESLEKHGCAPCPAILHSLVFTVNDVDTLFPGEFSYAYGEDRPMVFTRNKELRVGVLFMEYMEPNPRSLYKEFLKDKTIVEQKKGEATRLYCMALECGVNHRDAHLKNFLINDKNQLTLIDFGIAKLLTEEEMTVLALIPPGESHDTALRDEIRKLSTRSNAWFLSDPFTIGPYPPPLPEEVVEQCKDGLCAIEYNEREGAEEEHAMRVMLAERALAKKNALDRKRKMEGERAIEDREIDAILEKRRPPPKDPREATLFRAQQREGSERERIRMELREKRTQRTEKVEMQPKLTRDEIMLQKAVERRETERLQQEATLREAREKQVADRREKQEQARRAAGETRRVQAEELQMKRIEILQHTNVPTIPKDQLSDATLEQLKAEIIHVKGSLPDLSELRKLFSNEINFLKDEEYEKNMYVFYLTKMHTVKGGTRKRRKRTLKK